MLKGTGAETSNKKTILYSETHDLLEIDHKLLHRRLRRQRRHDPEAEDRGRRAVDYEGGREEIRHRHTLGRYGHRLDPRELDPESVENDKQPFQGEAFWRGLSFISLKELDNNPYNHRRRCYRRDYRE